LTSRRSPDLGVPAQSRDMFHKNKFETAFSRLGSLNERSWIYVVVRAWKYLVSVGKLISVKQVIEFRGQARHHQVLVAKWKTSMPEMCSLVYKTREFKHECRSFYLE
jgi:hypothetical protein